MRTALILAAAAVAAGLAPAAAAQGRGMPSYEPQQGLRTALDPCSKSEVVRNPYCVKKCEAGFRMDLSGAKPRCVLWMNQIGGLAILAAIFFIHHNGYGEATFTNLLANVRAEGILLPLALLSMAALIKGAQMPFSKWLLGAMVAPTPVSALLHSSTMVKIAPFIILRLSPALKDTPVAYVIMALTGFVFVAAAIGALSQDNFKRILAHSTIALLALMIMMAAVATTVTITASLITGIVSWYF